MKKIIPIIIFFCLFVSIDQLAAASTKNTIEITMKSDTYSVVEGADYIISDGRILISPRYIPPVFDFIVPGKGIWWDNEVKSVVFAYLDKDDYIKPRVSIKVGEDYLTDLDKKIPINTKAKLVSGRVYLPLRAISEAYGKEVQWNKIDGQTKIQIKE